jgi:hypothetical protein
MATMRTLGTEYLGAEQPLARVREGMEVADASGERFGRVIDVWIGTAAAISGGFAFASVTRAHQAPSVTAEPTEALRQAGCIKIEDTRYFRKDFRYYATIDQISSVDASIVRLDRHCRDLLTTFD